MKVFDRNWQDRWVGLADILERAMENQFYRLLLCLSTVALILTYVYVGTKLAAKDVFRPSPLIEIKVEDVKRPLAFLEIGIVNHAIENIERIHSALSIVRPLRPTPIRLELGYFLSKAPIVEWEIETHVLRLWMDELRGQPPMGAFDLASESVAQVVLWTVFPESRKRVVPPVAGTTWFENLGKVGNRANPMSLVPWVANQLYQNVKKESVLQSFGSLPRLMAAATAPELMNLERVAAWPINGAEFGSNLEIILAQLGSVLRDQTLAVQFPSFTTKATLPYRHFRLTEEQDHQVTVGLAVVSSCRFPQVQQLATFEARELVWIQDCGDIRAIQKARDARSFAKLNPSLVMAKVGIREVRLALRRGWISSDTLITELESRLVAGSSKSLDLPALLRVQKTEWLADARVMLLKAPVEALPFVRFDEIDSQTL